jgi:hypothetical protein
MDPNKTLEIIRKSVNAIVWDEETDITELAEAFEALDEWLKTGGFLPADWARP